MLAGTGDRAGVGLVPVLGLVVVAAGEVVEADGEGVVATAGFSGAGLAVGVVEGGLEVEVSFVPAGGGCSFPPGWAACFLLAVVVVALGAVW